MLLESLPQDGELVLHRTGRDLYAFRSLRVSKSACKQEAADRSGAKKAEKKTQAAKDKETGLTGYKRQAREALIEQVLNAEREFVQTVAAAQGWDKVETLPALTASLTRRRQIC